MLLHIISIFFQLSKIHPMYQLCGLVVQHVLYYNWHFDLYGGGLILQMFYTCLICMVEGILITYI